MALLPLHDFFLFNDTVQPVKLFIPSENDSGVYEVLRVEEGIPLFLEDHLKRFYTSAKIAGKSIQFTEFQIEQLLIELIEINKTEKGNILISCQTNFKAFFIPHKYPTSKMVENGVICGILKAERENPNAKVFQTSVREKANEMINGNGFFEVLLIDRLGRITEGSRTNIFFVKDDFIVTPPAIEVLLGITRQKVFELAKAHGIKCAENDVFLKDASFFKAAFLTGTSPKILPLNKLEQIDFNPENIIVRKLLESYDLLIQNYVSNKKACK